MHIFSSSNFAAVNHNICITSVEYSMANQKIAFIKMQDLCSKKNKIKYNNACAKITDKFLEGYTIVLLVEPGDGLAECTYSKEQEDKVFEIYTSLKCLFGNLEVPAILCLLQNELPGQLSSIIKQFGASEESVLISSKHSPGNNTDYLASLNNEISFCPTIKFILSREVKCFLNFDHRKIPEGDIDIAKKKNTEVIVICGPPLSGKSTLIKNLWTKHGYMISDDSISREFMWKAILSKKSIAIESHTNALEKIWEMVDSFYENYPLYTQATVTKRVVLIRCPNGLLKHIAKCRGEEFTGNKWDFSSCLPDVKVSLAVIKIPKNSFLRTFV